MTKNSAIGFLDDLDLTDAQDLLIALHHFRHWPAIKPIDSNDAMQLFQAIKQYGPRIFGAPDSDLSPSLVSSFLCDAGGVVACGRATCRMLAPREWLCVFRAAFERGDIGPVAFGNAVRFLMVKASGNGVPGLPADSLAARRIMLADARHSSPFGLMEQSDRDTLAALPDNVTLWRGGCYSEGAPAIERAQSLHWAPKCKHALDYLRRRKSGQIMKKAHSFFVGGVNSNLLAMQLERPIGDSHVGVDCTNLITPGAFLLRADVPKELLIAYIAAGPERQQVEVWLDFDRIEPGMVRDVTPVEFQMAA